MSKTEAHPRKRIKLLKPHRHLGRDYQPEQCLELPEGKADWLIAAGSAEAAPAPSPAAAPTPAAVPAATPKTKEQ